MLVRWGSGGRAVERRTVNRGDGGSIPPTAVSKLRQFRLPHICLCLLEETLNSIWCLCDYDYASGSKRSHTVTGGKCVTCSGLTNSRGELLRYPIVGLFGGNHLRTKNNKEHVVSQTAVTAADNTRWSVDKQAPTGNRR